MSFLLNYIQVDVIGNCPGGFASTGHQEMTKEDIAKKYKFVLILEEYMCKDMVSRDFFEYMSLPIVPVVFGSANYKHIAPDYSYIDANQFKSASDLAQYLQYIDQHFGETITNSTIF